MLRYSPSILTVLFQNKLRNKQDKAPIAKIKYMVRA